MEASSWLPGAQGDKKPHRTSSVLGEEGLRGQATLGASRGGQRWPIPQMQVCAVGLSSQRAAGAGPKAQQVFFLLYLEQGLWPAHAVPGRAKYRGTAVATFTRLRSSTLILSHDLCLELPRKARVIYAPTWLQKLFLRYPILHQDK